MRNRSKRFHLPSQEWSKIVRFNSQDYFLRSVYDKDDDISKDDSLLKNDIDPDAMVAPTNTVLDELPFNKIILKKNKRSKRVNEDFLDDMEEFGFSTETPEEVAKEVKKSVDAELATDLTYFFADLNGNQKELQMSADNFRNVIMFLLQGIIAIHPQDDATKVDQYVFASGRLNNLFAYRMNVIDVKCIGGIPKFIVSQTDNSNRRGGYINVHFTEERDAIISINFPGIGYKRPHSLVTMTYEDFCEFLPYDRITGRVKPAQIYYTGLLNFVLDKIKSFDSGLTLMERTGDTSMAYAQGEHFTGDAAFLKNNFRPVQKYSSKSAGDINALIDAVDEEMEQVEFIAKGTGGQEVDPADKWFVMLAGSETMFDRLEDSIWGGRFGSALPTSSCIHAQLFTKDPLVPSKRVEHNVLLIPLSLFVSRLPALWLWFMC